MDADKITELQCFCKSSYFVGGDDWLREFCGQKGTDTCSECSEITGKFKDYEKLKDKIQIHLQNYLQLDNVSFLFGTGSSLHLGAISIRNIPKQIEEKIAESGLDNLFSELVKKYQRSADINRTENGEIKVPLEDFLNFLLALRFVAEKTTGIITIENNGNVCNLIDLDNLISTIKQGLFELCDLDNLSENWFTQEAQNVKFKTEMEDNGALYYHKKLIKSLLQRPLNLKRANIFSLNYDLAFEKAFDELGVYYIDGFCGFHKRVFRPESYDYDIYYPGTTTEGKVRRIERVIRYFKLHGSLTWLQEDASEFNQYGLAEKPIEMVRSNPELAGKIMIYPTSYKKGYTLDFPYSELFRQFASTITQPQSVLFCIGYSFYDEHINDIIYQALSIPSFTLVIVNFAGTQIKEIDKLRKLKDPRIIILEGEYLGDFKLFARDIMPNFHDIDIREKVVTTLKHLYGPDRDGQEE